MYVHVCVYDTCPVTENKKINLRCIIDTCKWVSSAGVVVGEAAVVGDHVGIHHYVTLGGTGKQAGDRHPKVADYAQIGAKATVLGNIRIGRYARVAAASLVLNPVPDHTLVAGSPAREIGPVGDIGWVL
jgi:serine O-acetyltransferase